MSPEYQVELRFRLQAASQHEAHLWAAEVLDIKPIKENRHVKYRDAHVITVPQPDPPEAPRG